MANYQEFMERADETALSLTRSSQNWTAQYKRCLRKNTAQTAMSFSIW